MGTRFHNIVNSWMNGDPVAPNAVNPKQDSQYQNFDYPAEASVFG